MSTGKDIGNWVLQKLVYTILTLGINLLVSGKKHHRKKINEVEEKYRYPKDEKESE